MKTKPVSAQAGFAGMVILPARNEAQTVGDVVRSVKKCLRWDVVVINDASTDDTAHEARAAGAHVISLPFQMGAWGAAQTGMRFALLQGHEFVLAMDADGQHIAESLDAVLAPVVSGVADVSVGICPERVSVARRLAWYIFKRITGLKLQDLTSGLRVYNEDAMLVLTTQGAVMLDYQDIGVLLMLRDADLQITEVEVQMAARSNGHSRVYDSWATVGRYLAETLILSMGKWHPSWHMNDMFVISGADSEEK